jgi:transcriptional regulator with XRE-family HTH domain
LVQDEKHYKMIIGSRLKALRIKNKPGFSRKAVADELKIPPTTYNDWEGGRRGPNGGTLVMLAEYHNTTVDYLTGHTDDDSPADEMEIKKALKKIDAYVSDGSVLNENQLNIFEKHLNDILIKLKSNK